MKVKVYPNPVTVISTIQYELEESGIVNISVMDMNGKQMANLFTGFKPRGKQTLALNNNGFNINKLSNGIYLLQTTVNGKRKVEKFVVSK